MAAIAMALLPTPTPTPTPFTLPCAPRDARSAPASSAQFATAAVRNRGGEAAVTERAAQPERECAGGDENEDGEFVWSRRGIVGASVVAALAGSVSWSCEAAQAFSLGICKVGLTHHWSQTGPKDWLKAQKRKTVQFLLNPIEASRNHLNSAVLLLSSADGSSFENYEEAGKLVKVAARDCMPAESGSIIEFQSRTGVETLQDYLLLGHLENFQEVLQLWTSNSLKGFLDVMLQVCTFRLVLKNAASLLENDDPVKLEATAALDNLIRSFIIADGMLAKGGASAANQKEDVMGALNEAMMALNCFEQGVQNCLNVA